MNGGTYALFFKLPTGFSGQVGALGEVLLPPGRYCYVGSASTSLDARLGRHSKPSKKLHWHIDFLTVCAKDFSAIVSPGGAVPECTIATMAVEAGMRPVVKGFGCSDCKCQTHLFFAPNGSQDALMRVAGMHSYPVPAPKGY